MIYSVGVVGPMKGPTIYNLQFTMCFFPFTRGDIVQMIHDWQIQADLCKYLTKMAKLCCWRQHCQVKQQGSEWELWVNQSCINHKAQGIQWTPLLHSWTTQAADTVVIHLNLLSHRWSTYYNCHKRPKSHRMKNNLAIKWLISASGRLGVLSTKKSHRSTWTLIIGGLFFCALIY